MEWFENYYKKGQTYYYFRILGRKGLLLASIVFDHWAEKSEPDSDRYFYVKFKNILVGNFKGIIDRGEKDGDLIKIRAIGVHSSSGQLVYNNRDLIKEIFRKPGKE